MSILKKIMTIALVLSLVAGLCACGNKNNRPAEEPQRVPVQEDNTTGMENTESSAKEDKFPEISKKYTEAYIQETVETIGASKGLFYNTKSDSHCVENADGTYTLYCERTKPYTFSVENLVTCFVVAHSIDAYNAMVIYEKDGAMKVDLLYWFAENQEWAFSGMNPGSDLVGILTGTTEGLYVNATAKINTKEYTGIKDVAITEDGVIFAIADGKIFNMGSTSELGITLKPGQDKVYLSCDVENTTEGTSMQINDRTVYFENNDKHTLCIASVSWLDKIIKIAMPEGTTTDDIQDITFNDTTDTGHMLLKNGYVYVAFNIEQGGKWVLDTEVTTLSLEKDIVDMKTARRHQIVVQDYDFYLHFRVADGTEYYVQYPQQ